MYSHLEHKLIFTSPPVTIGKTNWRLIVFEKDDNVHVYRKGKSYPELIPSKIRFTRYQFFDDSAYWRGDKWTDETEHPRYNPNDGTYGGLPKKLRNIFYSNVKDIESALNGYTYDELKIKLESE